MTAGAPRRIEFQIRVVQTISVSSRSWIERYSIPGDENEDDEQRVLGWIRKQIDRWNRDNVGALRSVSRYRVGGGFWTELEEPIE